MNHKTVIAIRFVAGIISLSLSVVGLLYLCRLPSALWKVAAVIGAASLCVSLYYLIKGIEHEED